jgi:uncharacterized protein
MNHRYIILFLILLFCGACKSVVSSELQTQNEKMIEIAQAKESTSPSQMLPITAQATIKETLIDLEVAQTPEQQAKGLMFREALPDNRGMFFPFSEARIARFWMNNVPVALDMIFIKEGKVIAIAHSAPPCQTKPENCPLYGPDTFVDGVIELRGGRAKELNLTMGDLIEIRYLDKELPSSDKL